MTLTPGSVPIYLEIQDVGDTLTAATSTNGVNYTLIPGSTATVILPYTSLAGLAVSSGANGPTAGTATINNVVIGSPNNTPQDTAASNACPASWTCQDIGDPLLVGNQSVTSGTWTIQGAGNGIEGNYDQLHYVSQSITGDATATVRIDSQSNTSGSALAGLMMRADNTPGAAYYGAFTIPNNGGIQIESCDPRRFTGRNDLKC